MKRLLVFFVGLLLLGWAAGAQTSREELLSHLELTGGNYANYPTPTGHLTPAPAKELTHVMKCNYFNLKVEED